MKKVPFRPTDYDHLDSGKLVDFVTEFLRRNKTFVSDTRRRVRSVMNAKDSLTSQRHFLQKYGVLVSRSVGSRELEINPAGRARSAGAKRSRSVGSRKLEINLPPLVWAAPCRYNDVTSKAEDALGPDVKARLFDPEEMPFLSVNGLFFQDHRGRESWSSRDMPLLITLYSSMLPLMLDLSRPLTEILGTAAATIKYHKKRRDAFFGVEEHRTRRREWKLYLMAYDLREKGLTFSEVADVLSQYLPKGMEDWEAKRYYEGCRRLISGGYKQFIGCAIW